MSKRKNHDPMTRGKALIEARALFGPAAHVQVRGTDLVILSDVGGRLLADGKTWDRAITNARKVAEGRRATTGAAA